MTTWKTKQSATVLVLASLAAGSAFGQNMYRCKNGPSTYVSDRPCTTGAGTKLTAYGPAPTPSPGRSSYESRLNKAPEHLPYLSAPCAQLNDAIRTASVRGVGSTTQSELREEYQRKCSEDEQAAYQQLAQDKRQQRDARKAELASQQTEQARSIAAREQCHEMLRILHERRKRIDAMSGGERSDFQRFEASYNERCR